MDGNETLKQRIRHMGRWFLEVLRRREGSQAMLLSLARDSRRPKEAIRGGAVFWQAVPTGPCRNQPRGLR